MIHFSPPLIMGILNVTPDSFSDGGLYFKKEKAIQRALQLVEAGADVIDIGGESSRPYAKPISVQEEIDRVLPVLEGIQKETHVKLSIDTTKPQVMQEVLRFHVWMINDIYALRQPGALSVMKETTCQICLMHMQGQPETMQHIVHYERPVVAVVQDFFKERVQACTDYGIDKARLWLDPGIGFGKDISHNLMLLKEIATFLSLGLSVMVGVSRKSVLGHLIHQPVDGRLHAGLAAAIYLVLQGVQLIRTHDVKETKEAFLTLHAIYNASRHAEH